VKIGTRRAAVAAIVAIVVAAAAVAAYQVRRIMVDTRPMLPMTFAHLDHREVNCIICHHNFADDTGEGLCIDCHKTDPKIRLQIEPMFHTLCRDCHVEKHAAGKDAGPVRRCADCHTADDAP
jgi:Class III cytochrome C family